MYPPWEVLIFTEVLDSLVSPWEVLTVTEVLDSLVSPLGGAYGHCSP